MSDNKQTMFQARPFHQNVAADADSEAGQGPTDRAARAGEPERGVSDPSRRKWETIITPRLELISATTSLLQAELDGRSEFSRMLGARVPEAWPPELYDRQAVEWTLRFLEGAPERDGWALWYCLLAESGGNERTLIGVVGYKGAPSDGTVEIGYGILPAYQRRGFASEASLALVRRAFARANIDAVVAETFPELIASIGVLRKLGFAPDGPGSEERTIRFRLTRARFQEAQGCEPAAVADEPV